MYLETLNMVTDLATLPALPAAEGDGLFDWIDNLASDTRSTLINVAKAVIVVGVLVGLAIAKGRPAPSLIALATAAFLWWAVGSFSDDGIQDKIDNEVNSAPAVIREVTPPDAGATDGRVTG